jgi:hypothetical protein
VYSMMLNEKQLLLILAVSVICFSGCAISPDHSHQEYSPKFYLPAGTRVTIIPENGEDCFELSHKLYELFASRGYYKLIDRANLGDNLQERAFQNMSFVEKRPVDNIAGVDAFLYLQAECNSSQSQSLDPISTLLSSSAMENNAEYVAIYRMVLVSNGQIIAARQIRLADREGFIVYGTPIEPLIQKLRNNAAMQIFESLHP